MARGIYLRRGGELIQMSETRYSTEADLQQLLATHPDLLSADGEPHRWVLVSREFGVASEEEGSDRWSVDHLFLDEEGVPTLVEVKRSTDTRIRRAVVGQMLDYAANALSYWQTETIRARFEAACDDDRPDQVLAEQLGLETDANSFWERVGTHLAARRLRLVFVADVIPVELRAIVEFLNEQMREVEVLAVEVRQYVDQSGDHQTLVPRLIGETQAARIAKGRTRPTAWTHESWIAAYREARGEAEAAIVEQLLTWASEHDLPLGIVFGSGAKDPAAMIKLPDTTTVFSVSRGYTQSYIAVGFGSLMSVPPFDDLQRRHDLKQRLETIPDVRIDDRQLDRYPSLPVAAIAEPERFERFIETVEWVVRETTAASV